MKKKGKKRKGIVMLGNKILRKKAEIVVFSKEKKVLKNISKKLIKLCAENDGVGIAAPQIGISKRMFIIWSKPSKRYKMAPKMEKPLVVINPKIVSRSKKVVKDWEGCLSIPGLRARVSRSFSLGAEFEGEDGQKISQKFSGFTARIFQHEADHLEGILFIDRVKPTELYSEEEFKKIIK